MMELALSHGCLVRHQLVPLLPRGEQLEELKVVGCLRDRR
jgi:hypothetical protein